MKILLLGERGGRRMLLLLELRDQGFGRCWDLWILSLWYVICLYHLYLDMSKRVADKFRQICYVTLYL
jgi:hypothetical protein